MSPSKIALAAFVASLLSCAAIADSAPAASPPPMSTMGGHGMMRGMFTQEERMMLFADMSRATTSLSDDQKHAYRHEQRDRIMAMSDSVRAKFKANLDTRWNALPAEQKAAMLAKMQAFLAEHHQGGGQNRFAPNLCRLGP
jgi:hypothetical protein